MAGVKGKRACVSGNGRGALGSALRAALLDAGAVLVDDTPNSEAVDFALCTTGRMLIRDAGNVGEAELDGLYESNYRLPRLFTERHIAAMRAAGKRGMILHLGSNAARYGNAGAEDYSAFKAALVKYLELRGRSVRDSGIRLCVLNLGAVDTDFWRKVGAAADPELARQIMPHADKALSVADVVETVLSVIRLPERVALKDALIVSTDYQ